ncbi:MAG: catalase [Polyangia bacterium]
MATKKRTTPNAEPKVGKGGEPHQLDAGTTLTTNQGVAISDDQNSLRIGDRGPTLLEDFILREKITHFDHERIPERIVHARGSAAHGYFQPTKSLANLSKADFLQNPRKRIPVFARFSTVAGGAGSVDTPRDVRGFAVKFYTDEGNFDLVGVNMPVFFIQDTMKFPDLIHAVKMEPDRGFPQAASAHDTFWDWASLTPESTHMLLWIMSDRAIPRSLRMIDGFGVHTFRLVNAEGKSTFVKFHWRPTIGAQSTTWDEAVKLAGADPDFHRRDLYEAIESGDFPEWTLCIQSFDDKRRIELEKALSMDVLDPTKLIPEELVPLETIGKMVLDRNPDNFFAETEQVAFCPSHVVPGIDFTDDALLQGRLFSYLDTQISRLGGPNFHQLPINAPKCPFHNMQRDGIHQMQVPKGRVSYEPASLDDGEGPRENPTRGFTTFPARPLGDGTKVRQRAATFADHYSQARLFYRSMTEPEQNHIVDAFSFELGKVETQKVRTRMLGRLQLVDKHLCSRVEAKLGMEGEHDTLTPAMAPVDLDESPTLSLLKKANPTLRGRKVGVLVADGSDEKLVAQLRERIEKEGGTLAVIAPKVGGWKPKGRGGKAGSKRQPADMALVSSPSIFFDAVALVLDKELAEILAEDAGAVEWVRNAFAHCKVIGHTVGSAPLLAEAGVDPDEGIVSLEGAKGVGSFVNTAKKQRIWDREPQLHATT